MNHPPEPTHQPCQCPRCSGPEVCVEKLEPKLYFAWIPDLLGSGGFGSTKRMARDAAMDFWFAAIEGRN